MQPTIGASSTPCDRAGDGSLSLATRAGLVRLVDSAHRRSAHALSAPTKWSTPWRSYRLTTPSPHLARRPMRLLRKRVLTSEPWRAAAGALCLVAGGGPCRVADARCGLRREHFRTGRRAMEGIPTPTLATRVTTTPVATKNIVDCKRPRDLPARCARVFGGALRDGIELGPVATLRTRPAKGCTRGRRVTKFAAGTELGSCPDCDARRV
jgi:hypothetical protein